MELFYWLLLAFFVLASAGPPSQAAGKPPAAPPDPADAAASDFAIYRDAVADQNSRLDSLDSSLGALAALLFGILSYLPSHRTGDHFSIPPVWIISANLLLVGGILAALFAAITFRGSQGPRLDLMHHNLRHDRAKTLEENTDLLAISFATNAKLIGYKLEYFRGAVLAGALGTLVLSLAPVVH